MTRLTGLVEALLHEAQIASGGSWWRSRTWTSRRSWAGSWRSSGRRRRTRGSRSASAAREHVPWVETEPRFLRLILANLIGNAIKYTAEGFVEVAIERRGDELHVDVSDSGPGISPRTRSVFEPFERGAHAAEQFVPGLGLGLAVVRDLAGRDRRARRAVLDDRRGEHVHGGPAAPSTRERARWS